MLIFHRTNSIHENLQLTAPIYHETNKVKERFWQFLIESCCTSRLFPANSYQWRGSSIFLPPPKLNIVDIGTSTKYRKNITDKISQRRNPHPLIRGISCRSVKLKAWKESLSYTRCNKFGKIKELKWLFDYFNCLF